MARGEKERKREIHIERASGEERGNGRTPLMYLVMNTSTKETKMTEIEQVSDKIPKIVVSDFHILKFGSQKSRSKDSMHKHVIVPVFELGMGKVGNRKSDKS